MVYNAETKNLKALLISTKGKDYSSLRIVSIFGVSKGVAAMAKRISEDKIIS